jgi:hypothetical protein
VKTGRDFFVNTFTARKEESYLKLPIELKEKCNNTNTTMNMQGAWIPKQNSNSLSQRSPSYEAGPQHAALSSPVCYRTMHAPSLVPLYIAVRVTVACIIANPMPAHFFGLSRAAPLTPSLFLCHACSFRGREVAMPAWEPAPDDCRHMLLLLTLPRRILRRCREPDISHWCAPPTWQTQLNATRWSTLFNPAYRRHTGRIKCQSIILETRALAPHRGSMRLTPPPDARRSRL